MTALQDVNQDSFHLTIYLSTDMKLTDKEAVEKVKEILKVCSPSAHKMIQALVSPAKTPSAPLPRSMAKEAVVAVPPEKRNTTQIFDESKAYSGPVDTSDDDWLKDWIK